MKSILFFLFLSAICGFSQEHTVLFRTDSYQLNQAEKDQLKQVYQNELGKVLSGNMLDRIFLTGHTDNAGSDNYNLELSRKRVDEVKTYLVELGIPRTKIETDHYGESKPLNRNNSSNEMQENRRVQMTWTLADIAPPDLETETQDDIDLLYFCLVPAKQEFCIDPTHDTLLRLEQGTIILIPAGAFDTDQNECLTFRAKEAYNYSDMIMENLTTTSNGEMLETAGMVYTEAEDNDGKQLRLNSGKSLTIMLPADTLRDDMGLFYGSRDPHTNIMNWESPKFKADLRTDGIWPYNFRDCIEKRDDPDCMECRILFCRLFGRMDEAIKGLWNEDQKAANKKFRDCQRDHRSRRKAERKNEYSGLAYGGVDCQSLMEQYGVSDWETLQDTLGKIRDAQLQEFYAEYGVSTYAAYRDTIQKIQLAEMQAEYEKYGASNRQEYLDTLRIIREKAAQDKLESIEKNLTNNQSNIGDLNYYIVKTSQLGWINCDAFSNVPDRLKITMATDVPFYENYDCRLIFETRKSILPAKKLANGNHGFLKVPKGETAWLLALKYENKQPFIYLEKVKVEKTADPVTFRQISLEDLKIELKKLDF